MHEVVHMRIKLLTDTAKAPTRGSEYAAGFDIYADISDKITVWPKEKVMISTGVAMEIPVGYFGGIFARSGMAKRGLRPNNCVGVVDSDYRGDVIVGLYNDSDEHQEVFPGDRIAQLIIIPYNCIAEIEVVDELSDTSRGDGGFGSTGR